MASLKHRAEILAFVRERAEKSVLLVEDDKHRHRWFTRFFMNHELLIVESAERAIRLFEKGREFDLVCLDNDLVEEHYRAVMWLPTGGMSDSEYSALLPHGTAAEGIEVARFFARRHYTKPVLVHTMNTARNRHICDLLPHAWSAPFHLLAEEFPT